MASDLPNGFVHVHDRIPTISVDLRYYSDNNFVGRRIDGYSAPRAILSVKATQALKKVQTELGKRGLGLKFFDAYRPKRAVRHFYRWSKDYADTRTKATYYPNIAKRDLFRAGYIARRSGHSRGGTVDLTIIDLKTGKELDMGSPFDFFGPVSWCKSDRIAPRQKANRKLLRTVMMKHGFKPYRMEWWHFTLKKEPFPRTYFDFEVK